MITRRKFFEVLAGAAAAVVSLPKMVEAAKSEPVGWRNVVTNYGLDGLPSGLGNPIPTYNAIPIKYVNCLKHGDGPCDCPEDHRTWYWLP